MSVTAEPDRRTALTGLLLAIGGSVVLSVNDMAVKALSEAYPLHQVVLIRALIGLAFVLAVLTAMHGPRGLSGAVATRRPGLHAARVACVLMSNITYFLGLAALPLADGVAIFFVAPLLITALSVPFLGERVGWRRWTAVCVGLAGVILIMRPGGGGAMGPAALVLLSAGFYAGMHVLTRAMAPTESVWCMTFWTHAGFVVLSLGMGLALGDGRFAAGLGPSLAFLLRAWAWPPVADWPFFLATGLAVTVGGLMLSQAYRICPPSLIAPFEYTGIPMAIFWGAAIFGTWPDGAGWLGIALIVGAGLYTLWRETRARGDEERP
jgi:drug/metabolite transporter (DMT)-like permease